MTDETPEAASDPHALAEQIKTWAKEMGFDLAGIAPASPGLGHERLAQWLDRGWHGEMEYMSRQRAARQDPASILPGVRSIVLVALGYRTSEPNPAPAGFGRISRYAWGQDYHDVLRAKLKELGRRIAEHQPGIRWRAAVDSAPLAERDYAQLAGLGWIGKNTLLLNRQLGSWFFLGALLLDIEIPSDAPFETNHCGTCTRCLDACPTQAFVGPYELDARRCISYLTIEHRTEIPEHVKPLMGDWIFGCDICQEVCPWNRRAPETNEAEFSPTKDNNPIEVESILKLDDESFLERFQGTPLERTGRERLARNAAIVAANQARC